MSNIIQFPVTSFEYEDGRNQEYEEFIAQYINCCNTFIEIGELIAAFPTIQKPAQLQELAKDIIHSCVHLRNSVFEYNKKRNELSCNKKKELDEIIPPDTFDGFIETCDESTSGFLKLSGI